MFMHWQLKQKSPQIVTDCLQSCVADGLNNGRRWQVPVDSGTRIVHMCWQVHIESFEVQLHLTMHSMHVSWPFFCVAAAVMTRLLS